jgi:hypothetical protein
MRAHSETMTQGTHLGMPAQVSGLGWLQRLRQWVKSFVGPSAEIPTVSRYGIWDAQREVYRPLKADAARDLEAAQHDVSWSVNIYSLSI